MAKRAELEKDHPLLDKEEALKAFENCRRSLEHMMRRLAIPIPPLARVSGIFVPFHYLVLTAFQFFRPPTRKFLDFSDSLEMLPRRDSKAMTGCCGQ